MILKKLKNFRGYSELEVPIDKNFNVVIGKNDVGKSTILEALEIFFNNSNTVKLEIQDLHVWHDVKEIEIGVTFEVDKSKGYIIDTDNETNLEDEFLLNPDGDLEILKVWDCSKNLTAKSLKTYLVSNYLTEFKEKPLVLNSITDLKKIAKAKDVEDNVDDKRTRADYRKAIYDSLDNRELETVNIPVDKEDAKTIWTSLSAELPFFALFQSDRQNKDSDKEVQDPLKVITKQAIAEKEKELIEVVDQIKAKAEAKGKQTIKKLEEMNPEIAKTLFPNVKNKNWDSLFSFSFTGDEGIPMNKRGSGVRRLILLNYFRAEAEDKAKSAKGVIYAIEEPETSQHPDYQVMLVNSLIELSETENKQVLITTHSPEIAKIASNKNLLLISKNGKEKPKIVSDEEVKLTTIKETLGILPYLSKLVICVEGEWDIKFLKNINQNISELKAIIDLEEKDISVIPLNGGNLKNWIDRNYLKDSNIVEFHIYDRDTNSGRNTEQYLAQYEQINAREDESVCVLTNKREMENYIPKELIETEFSIDCSAVADWNIEDIPTFVQNKTDFDEKAVKGILNGKLAKQLTKEHLEQSDSFEEIKSWFEQIKAIFEG
jgi:predicted ATP-dependent endonuclease of OLD family